MDLMSVTAVRNTSNKNKLLCLAVWNLILVHSLTNVNVALIILPSCVRRGPVWLCF